MLRALWPRAWMRAIEHRLDRADAEGLDLDRRARQLWGRVNSLEDKLASVQILEANLGTLTRSVADLGARVQGIVQTSADLKTQVADLQAKVAAGVDIPDADIQAISDNVTAIQQMAQSSS